MKTNTRKVATNLVQLEVNTPEVVTEKEVLLFPEVFFAIASISLSKGSDVSAWDIYDYVCLLFIPSINK